MRRFVNETNCFEDFGAGFSLLAAAFDVHDQLDQHK